MATKKQNEEGLRIRKLMDDVVLDLLCLQGSCEDLISALQEDGEAEAEDDEEFIGDLEDWRAAIEQAIEELKS